MSEEKRKLQPWDQRGNPELPQREWSVYRWSEGSGKSEVKPRLYEVGTVEGADHAEARGYADQKFGHQMYDYVAPIGPDGKPLAPPPKAPDPTGVK